jgi:hypothetical protein
MSARAGGRLDGQDFPGGTKEVMVASMHRRLVVDRSPVVTVRTLDAGALGDLLEEQDVWFWLVHLVVLPAQALHWSQ